MLNNYLFKDIFLKKKNLYSWVKIKKKITLKEKIQIINYINNKIFILEKYKIYKAIIINIIKDNVIIYINENKYENIIPIKDFCNKKIKIGDIINVMFLKEKFNEVVFSYKEALKIKIWKKILLNYKNNKIFKAQIYKKNNMGYILKIEKCIYAFLPNDRLINNYKYNIKSFIKIFIININFKKKNIIVSNKNFYYYENFNKKILKYGFYNNKIILGKIKNKNNDKFIVKINNNIKGIFLKKKNIKNKIEINKNYKFKILKINFNKKNIKLGLKNVKNIFLNKIINKNFKIGDIIWGKIYKINNYSIKLIVEKYYIKAVIPITELFWEFDIKKHKEKIKIGDVLKCIIIDINFFKKEIILSHKRLIHNNVL